jgi:hypothetical protein
MRLTKHTEHPNEHAALTDVGVDQHHDRPSNIEVSNTSLTVDPLPGGPGVWDIPVPLDARVVKFSLRSNHACSEGGGMAGVHGVATRSQLEATTFSLGGHATITTTAYNASYSKKASAANLSHKVFSAAATESLALTEAYLTLTGPMTRVLRLVWTNYGVVVDTLNCWGEIQVIG